MLLESDKLLVSGCIFINSCGTLAQTKILCWTFGELNICLMIYLSLSGLMSPIVSYLLSIFFISCVWWAFTQLYQEMEMLASILIACSSLYTYFSPVSNGAMATRSQCIVGCSALRVGVPSSTFQLLLILCGHLLDAQGQGRNQMFSTVFLWGLVLRQTQRLHILHHTF